MAFVVRRPAGRWEIRESIATKEGPRARTLASFKELTPAVIDHALAAARRPTDHGSLIVAAKKAGAPIAGGQGDRLAEDLLRALARGDRVRPGLRKLLIEALQRKPKRDDSLDPWVGASLQSRGDTLVDLMDFADALPKPRRKPLRFPGFRANR